MSHLIFSRESKTLPYPLIRCSVAPLHALTWITAAWCLNVSSRCVSHLTSKAQGKDHSHHRNVLRISLYSARLKYFAWKYCYLEYFIASVYSVAQHFSPYFMDRGIEMMNKRELEETILQTKKLRSLRERSSLLRLPTSQ